MKTRSLLLGLLLLTPAAAIAGTKYPIVLAHGLAASASVFSFQPVAQHLRKLGFEVFVTEVAAFNTIAFRGRQLGEAVDAILEESEAPKVNIIAHSMGGLDARHMISSLHFDDKVASLSTVSTPHLGSTIASVVLEALDDLPFHGLLIKKFMARLSSAYNHADSVDVDEVVVTLQNLTVDFVSNRFNPLNPDSPKVYYQSWAGITSLNGNPDKVQGILESSFKILSEAEGPNDGQVSVKSATWGNFRGLIPADHIDEIGKLQRSRSPLFHYLDFYTGIARDLAVRGF